MPTLTRRASNGANRPVCDRNSTGATAAPATRPMPTIQIHPFDDGNGRTGRLVTSWQCLRAGVPVIIIPVRHVDLYREALNIAADISDLRPLRTLLAACLVHEMAFAVAVAEGSADPTIANEDADPEKPVPPRGMGYTGNGP